jgi:ubiquinone/menaquinone biosynthesis C-methylase UbiE
MQKGQPANEPDANNAFNNVAVFLERLPNKKPLKPLSGIVKIITQIFYNLISNLDRDKQIIFMNYGYISLDPNYRGLELGPEDENHRYQIQMYHHIAHSVDWSGSHALEVGSGRGGGASYIKRHFKPRSMTGVDLSDKAVAFCNQYHSTVEGLRFVQGDAEALRFADESFDIIINVESSLYYPNVENFFKHVVRLLKPNGHFLYADMRFQDEVAGWRKQLQATGLELLSEEDITQNARQALSLNQEYRRNLVKKYAPRFLQRIFSRFGGADGGRLTGDSPTDGKRVYKKFVFRKTT